MLRYILLVGLAALVSAPAAAQSRNQSGSAATTPAAKKAKAKTKKKATRRVASASQGFNLFGSWFDDDDDDRYYGRGSAGPVAPRSPRPRVEDPRMSDETPFDQLPAEERLFRQRHSAAHVLAEAVQELVPGEASVRRQIVTCFDRTALFKGLLEHHDIREGQLLYPRLDEAISSDQAARLIERLPPTG